MRQALPAFLFLLFIVAAGYSQPPTFRLYVQPGNTSEGIRSVQLPDSSILSAANTSGFNVINQVYLLRLSASGSFISDLAIPLFGMSRISEMAYTAGGRLAFCGIAEGPPTQYYDGLLLLSDINGQVIAEQTFGGNDWDGFRSITELPDSGYCMAGYTFSSGQGNSDAWIVRVDPAGTQLWSRTFGDSGDDELWAICLAPWGLAACGSTTDTATGRKDVLLLALDTLGDTLWTRRWGSSGDDIAYALAISSDSGIVIAGQTNGFLALGNDGFLARFNRHGVEEWMQVYPGSNEDKLSGLVILAGDRIAASGTTTSFGAGRDEFSLYLTSSGGAFEGGGSYGGYGHDYFRSITLALDSGLLLTGSSTSFGTATQGMLVVKTDNKGVTVPNTLVITSVSEMPMSKRSAPFPNPSNGSITVPFAYEKVIVRNNQGIPLLIFEESEGGTLDISSLKPGIYLIELLTKEGTYTFKTIKSP